ncbi:MAG TPA: ATP-dependent DNA helicase RecG [Chthoniobacterales bacterium]
MIADETPLTDIATIPVSLHKPLERLELRTVNDLLTHYPRRHEDRTRFDRFPAGETETPVCIRGVITKATLRRFGGYRKMFDATLEEPEAGALSSPLILRWYNMHYMQKLIAVGQTIIVYGRARLRGKNLCIEHPEFEIADEGEVAGENLSMDRIAPIYPATEGITQRALRRVVFDVLSALETLETPLPEGLAEISRLEALKAIHFPESFEQLETARRHLVLTEFFGLQLIVARRRARTLAAPGAPHCGPGKLLDRFLAQLPFPPTSAQLRAITEIRLDLASGHPMNRLLQGDVGSGKTLVALSAMLLAVESGCQAALMAPTQLLAEQHYLNFCRLLEPLGISVALRTGARKEESAGMQGGDARSPQPAAERRPPQILIGTHALLFDSAQNDLPTLGLAVIDEQHKFGVLQRARLISRIPAPDVLVMTATPIPRTLTLTVYGDLDVSILDELPPGRGRIRTELREDGKLRDPDKFREYLRSGKQAYIVCSLIEESETQDGKTKKAATAEFRKWSQFLAPLKCELLHGRIAPDEKEAIMRRFRDGETNVLIATTVIEVGIDVPNATVMIIENAEKFGLAQLHQLRGRIGRGSGTSYCILLAGTGDDAALEKLRVLVRTSNGFEIAEADLESRGPGDILGTAQSGLPPLKIGNILRDSDLMRLARETATRIVSADPELSSPENQRFRIFSVESSDKLLSHVS